MKDRVVKCKNCGATIAKAARACPDCGARNKRRHNLYVGICIFFALCLVIAFWGEDATSPQAAERSSSASEMPEQEEKAAFSVGESVEINDIAVTLTDVSISKGIEFNKPPDGKVFAVCTFEIENSSNTDIAISSLMSFDAYVDDYSVSISLPALISTSKNQLDGKVAAGKKMNGVVGYEVPSDWSELQINFTPDFWSGERITFIARN